MAQAFSGVRVVDFSQVLSGPYLTLQLALQGADVVKVEPPKIGDQMRDRMLPSPLTAIGMASAFLALNHGKRSVAIDLKAPAGLALAFRLIEGADVMVHNFRGGVIERLGLDYAAVAARNPSIVYCAISGFGATGARARDAAYDGAVQAASGMMANNGSPETGPMRTGYFPVDMMTGMSAAFAVAAALLRRQREGVGQFLDVSMLDAALGLQASGVGQCLVDGNPGALIGNSSATHLPTADCFQTGDGKVLISAAQQNHAEALLKAIGLGHLVEDPRYVDTAARRANKASLQAAIVEALAADSAANWERGLGAAGVPVARVNSITEATSDPQLAGRAGILDVPAPEGFDRPLRLPAAPFVAATDGPAVRSAPPVLGQHSREVLGELGVAADEIERLVADGVVGVPGEVRRAER